MVARFECLWLMYATGNAGLGKHSIIALTKHDPKHIYLAARSAEKAGLAINEIKAIAPNAHVTFIECDLASLASVQAAAKQFITESHRLDILVCNGGVMAAPLGLTKDGFETHFGTNHLGHALLIKLLLPTLLSTAEHPDSDVRIGALTSTGSRFPPTGGILFSELRTTQDNLGTFGPWLRYGQSKLANLLYAKELAQRYPAITSVSVHPSAVETDLITKLPMWRRQFIRVFNAGRMKTVEEGIYNQVWASVAPTSDLVNGEHYEPVGKQGARTKFSEDEELRKELWKWTEEQLRAFTI